MKLTLLSFLLGSMMAWASPNVSINVLPANISGQAGQTVGWSFSISTLQANRWAIMNSVTFEETTPVGTFAPYSFPLVVGSGSGNADPYNEVFNAGAQTGVGAYTISNAAQVNDVSSGILRFIFSVFDADPTNDPNFDPQINLVEENSEETIAASVTVTGTSGPAVPEASSWATLVAGLGVLGYLRSKQGR